MLETSLSVNPRPLQGVKIAHPGGMIVSGDFEIAGRGMVARDAPQGGVVELIKTGVTARRHGNKKFHRRRECA